MTPTPSVCSIDIMPENEAGPNESMMLDMADTSYCKAVEQQKHYLASQSVNSQVVLEHNSLTNITYNGGMLVAES